jgi:hypothetical protein
MKAGCPFPNSPLDFGSDFCCARVRFRSAEEKFWGSSGLSAASAIAAPEEWFGIDQSLEGLEDCS